MAQEEGQYLLLQQGQNKLFLLLRSGNEFHIVTVDKRLTEEAEEKLLAIYPCSDASLRELGVNFQKISPRGVAVSGWEAGCPVILYIGKKRQKYVLSDNYGQKTIDAFFAGVPRFTPPQPKKSKHEEDWRKQNRDPDLYHRLRFVPPLLVVLMTVFSIGYVNYQTWEWYLGCLVCLVVPVILDIALPAYFTIMFPEKGKEVDAWELGWIYFIHLLVLIMFPGHNWLNENVFLLVWGIVGSSTALILGLFAEEFRRKKSSLLVIFLMVGLLGTFVVGHVNEAFDFSEPQSHILTVRELHDSRSRRNSTYKCTVTLPDGRQVDLEVSRDFYMSLEIGDSVLVEQRIGALGIEYANAFPVE